MHPCRSITPTQLRQEQPPLRKGSRRSCASSGQTWTTFSPRVLRTARKWWFIFFLPMPFFAGLARREAWGHGPGRAVSRNKPSCCVTQIDISEGAHRGAPFCSDASGFFRHHGPRISPVLFHHRVVASLAQSKCTSCYVCRRSCRPNASNWQSVRIRCTE